MGGRKIRRPWDDLHVALATSNISGGNVRVSVGYKQNCLWMVTGEAMGGRTTIAPRDEVEESRLTLKWLAFYLTDFMNCQRRLTDSLDQQRLQLPVGNHTGISETPCEMKLDLTTDERSPLITTNTASGSEEDDGGRLMCCDRKAMLWWTDWDGRRSCGFH